MKQKGRKGGAKFFEAMGQRMAHEQKTYGVIFTQLAKNLPEWAVLAAANGYTYSRLGGKNNCKGVLPHDHSQPQR